MFPSPLTPKIRRCRRCGTRARADRMIFGYGRACAVRLGLTGGTVDVTQDGPDLLDDLDLCDGWDR